MHVMWYKMGMFMLAVSLQSDFVYHAILENWFVYDALIRTRPSATCLLVNQANDPSKQRYQTFTPDMCLRSISKVISRKILAKGNSIFSILFY